MQGFSDGSMVSIEFNEDQFSLQMGTDGEGTRSKSNNYSARVTISLMQTSDSNQVLQGFWNSDRLSDSGIFPFLLKDNSGRTIYAAEQMWVAKQPSAEFGREAGAREWVLETDNMVPFEGGNL
jgi:hypothetical protein